MNVWQELVRQTLVGNISSNKISPILIEQLKNQGIQINKKEKPEKVILKAAAIYQKINCTAQIPNKSSETINEAPIEINAYCNAQRKVQLKSILRSNYDSILEEYLSILISKNLIILPELLPEILDFGDKHPHLQASIRGAIGFRGSWLAQFKESWFYASIIEASDNENPFFYGNRDERISYLKSIHHTNPKKAISLLEEVWDSEGFMTKCDFIRTIKHSLSELDEPLLERALSDPRREVRDQASEVLSFLPKSHLVERMKKLVQDLIKYDSTKNSFSVDLPQSCTKVMKRDGISPRKSFIKDHGPKANQLAQIISKIPPSWWADTCYKNPQELLLIAANTEWKNVFVWGWAMAAKNFKDKNWIIACHRFYLDTFFKHNWSNFSIDFMYQNLPNDLFNLLAEEYLKADIKKTLSDEHPIVSFLLSEGQKWSDKVALQVIKKIKFTIHQDAYVFHWSLKAILKRAAFSINPLLYDKIEEGWPTQSQAWYSWQKEVDNLLVILKFRKEIYETEDL